MQNLWTLNNLAQQTQGVLLSNDPGLGGLTFSEVTTDSRQCRPGCLYVAIKGERFNGHEFVAQAFEQGAVAALVSQLNRDKVLDDPLVLVEDTRMALGLFARWHRQQMRLKSLIAITGSNGKTTTKALLKTILETQGHTLATQGNLNNDFGVPRTLLAITPRHDFAVVEMGANHAGEILYLTQLAQPNIAIINNAADAHLAGFGDLNGVIQTKAEILAGLAEDGVAVLNRDSVGFEVWQAMCQRRHLKQVTFGQSQEADVQVQSIQQTADGLEFGLWIKADCQTYPVKMAVLGEHNALNAAAATAACLSAGLKMPQILPGLGRFQGVKGRLKTYALSQGVLIDDAYNANPASMKAGIQALVSLAETQTETETETDTSICSILVLGGMAELGEEAVQAHQEIARFALALGIEEMYLLGDLTRPMVEVFGTGAFWFATHAELIESLKARLAQRQQVSSMLCHILVKGSRSAGMEVVVQALLKEQ